MLAAFHSCPGRVQRALLRERNENRDPAQEPSNINWHNDRPCGSRVPALSARSAGTREAGSRHTGGEAFPDLCLRQLAADEDDAAFTLLARLPGALVVAVENHVHALEHESLVVVFERQDALAAQNVRPLLLDEVLRPGQELVRIDRVGAPERDRLHLIVVIVLKAAAVVLMTLTILVVMIVVMIVVMVTSVIEKFRLDLQNAVEIECITPEHLRQRNVTALSLVQLGIGIDAADARLHFAEFVGRDQVGLIEQDDIGERDLVLRLRRVLEPVLEPFGVGDGDDGVELGFAADIVVDEERLRHWRGVREPRGLEDDGVEFALPAHQPVTNAHEIAAHRAADAAVVHLEDFFVGADDEVVVDADLAELVDDDSVLVPVRLRQDAVEERRLAGAEIAGEHGDEDLIGHSHELRLAPYIYIRRRMPSCRSTRREPPNVDLSATPFLQIKVMRSSNRA